MGKYRLSEKADEDVQNIFEFGVDRFGMDQAETYVLGLHDQLAKLANQPGTWPHVEVQDMRFQRCVYQSHAIYYQRMKYGVLIVRILGQQDIDQASFE